MNIKHISLAFAAAAALLEGCAKSPIETPSDTKGLTDLELTHVGSTEVKSVIDGTDFPTKGEIGLFLFTNEAATKPYGETGYTNVKYAYNSTKGKWTANPSIKVGSTPGYLYGYYPYSSEAESIKTIPVASSLDGDDVMYASKQNSPITDQTASQTAITMNHALARVSITVKNNGYTGNAKLTSIKFAGAKTSETGTLDATTGTISGTTKADVTLDVTGDVQTITTAGTTYECLLVPSGEDESKQAVDLTLTIDGEDKTAKLSGDNGVIIAKGIKSNITIGLSNSGISVSSVSIDEWKEVEVGGHKVTVKFDEGVNVIEEDVLVTAYAKNGNAVIEAFSKSGKQITCQLDDDSMVNPEITDNISKFVIPVESKDIVATIGVWGEGGRREITIGGHKINVVYDEVKDIEEDVWMMAYAENGNAVIEAFSKSGKQITCQLDDDSMVNPEITDNISKFVIPVESKDIVATIGVWGEGGRNQITVGEHKVTVELANGVNESDVWFNAYVNSDGKAAVSVQSSNGKKLSFRRDDTGTILGIAPQDNIYDIVLSEVNQDITVTIDYFLNSNPEITTISGHKVSVVLDADTDILKGISIDNNGKLVIEAGSSSDKPVKCIKDNERITGSKTGTLYKFIISDITEDATITVGYSKYTATIGFAQGSVTDKATLKINGDEVEAGGSTSVFEGTNVEYSAVVDNGYLVLGWYDNNGQKVSDAESFTVSGISSDVAYYAEVKAGYKLTVNTIYAGTSTIAANGVSIESGRAYIYDPNTQITLTASPATGCQFAEWCDADGKTLSTENPYSFTLSDNLTIIAVFSELEGALSGVFTVSDDGNGNVKKVRFSKGNLYYDGTQSKYFFEAKQYDVPLLTFNKETDNHVGHFYWSKDANVARSLSNYTDSGASDTDVFFTNDSENQAKPNLEFTVNGQTGFWRVLSGGDNGEWSYLLNSRNTAYVSNRRYAAVKVNGMAGLLIFPDDFSSWPSEAGDEPQTFDTNSDNWNDRNYTVEQFTVLQNNGCVFLPAAGFRDGNPGSPEPAFVCNVGDSGYYWSASPTDEISAYDLYFYSGNVGPSFNNNRYQACSVRLVTESK